MVILGKCPVCGEDIIERPESYGCSAAKFEEDHFGEGIVNNGCRFYIYKKALAKYGKKIITKQEVKEILSSGSCVVTLKNRRTRQPYQKNAILDEEYGVSIDFDTEIEND